jgi:hypothetical protein
LVLVEALSGEMSVWAAQAFEAVEAVLGEVAAVDFQEFWPRQERRLSPHFDQSTRHIFLASQIPDCLHGDASGP